jgi:hypothetical protein
VYFDVAGEVEEVVGVDVLPINFLGEELDGIFVGYVLDHESGSLVVADAGRVNDEVVLVVLSHLLAVLVLHHLIGVVGVVEGVVVVGGSEGVILGGWGLLREVNPYPLVYQFVLFL